ncbi:MAG: PEGA domain-containing protein [Kiritimatiellaeota bacterium]|nr:PEGA domain-containing protein [Kiritimatiellota bacterium]
MKMKLWLIVVGALLVAPAFGQDEGQWRVTKVVETIEKVTEVTEKREPVKPVYRALIVVDNRAGDQYDEAVAQFEELVTGEIDASVLSIISREYTIFGGRDYSGKAPTASSLEDEYDRVRRDAAWNRLGNMAFGSMPYPNTPNLSQHERENAWRTLESRSLDLDLERAAKLSGTALTHEDWKTLRNSSSINMADSLQADLVLAVTFNTISVQSKKGSAYGVNFANDTYTLRGSYKLLDIVFGATVANGNVTATETIRQTDGLSIEDTGILATLMEKAAKDIAKGIKSKSSAIKALKIDEKTSVAVSCVAQDMNGQNLTVPDFYIDEAGAVRENKIPLAVEVVAIVEIDGFVLGTTPCTVSVRPGNHKFRLTSPGFKDASGNVSVRKDGGVKLDIPLQMSEDGLRRWKEIHAFAADLDRVKKATQAMFAKEVAEAARIRSQAALTEAQAAKILIDGQNSITLTEAQAKQIKAGAKKILIDAQNSVTLTDAQAKRILADAQNSVTLTDAQAKQIRAFAKSHVLLTEAQAEEIRARATNSITLTDAQADAIRAGADTIRVDAQNSITLTDAQAEAIRAGAKNSITLTDAQARLMDAQAEKTIALTPAEAKLLEGQAEMYRNSNFRLTRMGGTEINMIDGRSLYDKFMLGDVHPEVRQDDSRPAPVQSAVSEEPKAAVKDDDAQKGETEESDVQESNVQADDDDEDDDDIEDDEDDDDDEEDEDDDDDDEAPTRISFSFNFSGSASASGSVDLSSDGDTDSGSDGDTDQDEEEGETAMDAVSSLGGGFLNALAGMLSDNADSDNDE